MTTATRFAALDRLMSNPGKRLPDRGASYMYPDRDLLGMWDTRWPQRTPTADEGEQT